MIKKFTVDVKLMQEKCMQDYHVDAISYWVFANIIKVSFTPPPLTPNSTTC